jgi:hypothetical protein
MDLRRLELTGAASPVLEEVMGRQVNGLAHFAVTASGTGLYPGRQTAHESLYWVDAAGNTQDLGAAPADRLSPKISPDKLVHAVIGNRPSVLNWRKNAC